MWPDFKKKFVIFFSDEITKSPDGGIKAFKNYFFEDRQAKSGSRSRKHCKLLPDFAY
jgi:hypothetical protein